MANPVVITCTENQWTKVATNIETGSFHVKNVEPIRYYHVYLDTGDPPPAHVDLSLGIPLVGKALYVSCDAGVDVYFQPRGGDGSVRADL